MISSTQFITVVPYSTVQYSMGTVQILYIMFYVCKSKKRVYVICQRVGHAGWNPLSGLQRVDEKDSFCPVTKRKTNKTVYVCPSAHSPSYPYILNVILRKILYYIMLYRKCETMLPCPVRYSRIYVWKKEMNCPSLVKILCYTILYIIWNILEGYYKKIRKIM